MHGNRQFLPLIPHLVQSQMIIYKSDLPLLKSRVFGTNKLLVRRRRRRRRCRSIDLVAFLIDATLENSHPAAITGMIVDGRGLVRIPAEEK